MLLIFLVEDSYMALYEYKCKECGVVSEHLVYSDSDKVACLKCGSENLEKLLSGFAVSVKSGSSPADTSSCAYGGCCGGSCGIE